MPRRPARPGPPEAGETLPSRGLWGLAVRRPAGLFLALAFGWTSCWCLGLRLLGLEVAPGSPATHLPALAGPGIAAAVILGLGGGRAALADLARRCLRLPVRPAWVPVAILASPAVALAVFAGIEGRLPAAAELAAFPGLPEGLGLLPVLLLVLLLNGFGEEIGWRGFLFDRLAPAGTFRAALLVGLAWLAWHAPLFAVHAGMQKMIGPALLGWAASLVAASFLLGHLHLAAGRSIAAPALLHALFNLATAPPALAGAPAAAASALVIAWGAALGLASGRAALARERGSS